LIVNGNTLLSPDNIRSIGPNGLQTLSFSSTQTNKMTLTYGTPYDLVLRVDSESEVINTVPEPASVTLLGLGFGALGALRGRRRRSNASNPS
jgi:hypothetical protein